MNESNYIKGYVKETIQEETIRNKRIEFETIIDSLDLGEHRMEWSVSNLMWLNHHLPTKCRGRSGMEAGRTFIISLLRNRHELLIP